MIENDSKLFWHAFFRLESAGGVLLFIAAVVAMIFANSPLNDYYQLLLSVPLEIRIATFGIAKPLLLWVNDGLMAIFFFLVGLELKREFMEGEFVDKKNIILPSVGAVGGMIMPALIYLYFNWGDSVALNGWAVPVATDIAFALGVLALLGSRVPISIKIFLTSLAIFDDMVAILIIALFYTSEISSTALLVTVVCVLILFVMNRCHVISRSAYILMGLIMWVAILKSGIHATLAGVILAMFIPMRSRQASKSSPLKSLEYDLHAVVAFFVLPTFAFVNAGINLSNLSLEQLTHDVPVGVTLGLFIGKQIGILGFCWLFVRLQIAQLPAGMGWLSLYGTAALCGIGFTMSLFIGVLAFGNMNLVFDERLGIVIGSLLSGILGFVVLNYSLKKV